MICESASLFNYDIPVIHTTMGNAVMLEVLAAA
jgi:hypothetical protein